MRCERERKRVFSSSGFARMCQPTIRRSHSIILCKEKVQRTNCNKLFVYTSFFSFF